jgi:exodeoxyribonuclease V alpha subunit
MQIKAFLDRVLWMNPKNNYSVCRFVPNFDPDNADSLNGSFTAVGVFANIPKKLDKNIAYTLLGEWQDHPKYGRTFAMDFIEIAKPSNIESLEKFLVSNVPDLGISSVRLLLHSLDVKTVEDLEQICAQNPEAIRLCLQMSKPRKSPAKAQVIQNRIYELMVEDQVLKNIHLFLHSYDFSPLIIRKIYQKWGGTANQVLQENPYALTEIPNIGFTKADSMACKLGIDPKSQVRLRMATVYALEELSFEGHSCYPRDALVQKLCDLLSCNNELSWVPQEVLLALRVAYQEILQTTNTDTHNTPWSDAWVHIHKFMDQQTYFFLPYVHYQETYIAKAFCERKPADAVSSINWKPDLLASQYPGIRWEQLTVEQTRAVQYSYLYKFAILTGGPGCGKTFTLKAIYELHKQMGKQIVLAAPTGLAAKRMGQVIGDTAYTLHKILNIFGGQTMAWAAESEDSGKEQFQNADVVIIDECSMLGIDLLYQLMKALKSNQQLLLVGDADQLPSISCGNCLQDVIQSKVFPVVKLDKIFRQSAQSSIPLAAKQILSGKMPVFELQGRVLPPTPNAQLFFIECEKTELNTVLQRVYTDFIGHTCGLNPVIDTQVLVPIKKTEVGQFAINEFLQNLLNPLRPTEPEIFVQQEWKLRLRDKVIQTKNNYQLEIFNGDIGFVHSFNQDFNGHILEIHIQFSDKMVRYPMDNIQELQLCYAMTIHKSQGSEFPVCVIPVFYSYYTMLNKNMYYTAITRAKQKVIFVGDTKALQKAVRTENGSIRYTGLQEFLQPSTIPAIIPIDTATNPS